jgi:hypothetical protein
MSCYSLVLTLLYVWEALGVSDSAAVEGGVLAKCVDLAGTM